MACYVRSKLISKTYINISLTTKYTIFAWYLNFLTLQPNVFILESHFQTPEVLYDKINLLWYYFSQVSKHIK